MKFVEPIRGSTSLPNRLLLLAAAGNFGVASLHFALIFTGESTNRYFGAPPLVLRLLRQDRPLLILLILGIAALFALFGLYDVSGAGRLRRLPLLRGVLLAVGVVYTLRGLELPVDVLVALERPAFGRQFIVYSAFSLAIGVASLGGTFGQWKRLGRPARSTVA
jgi:hypothetical protein